MLALCVSAVFYQVVFLTQLDGYIILWAQQDWYFREPRVPVADWDYYPERRPRRDASWSNAEASKVLKPLNKEKCDRFMATIDTAPPPKRQPSGKACEGYDGVFHIHHYDHGGASGTAFFMFNLAMLSWADQHNYLPWIHIEDGYTVPIWDPVVHMNTTDSSPLTFQMQKGMKIGWARDRADRFFNIFPGKPFLESELETETFEVKGTGVWEHYFLPPNDFVPGDASCRDKPIVKMEDDQIVPGLHANAPFTPRAWRTTEVPNILKRDMSWDDWFAPQRAHGAALTKRYIRFNPMIEQRVRCSFPDTKFSLGMHIRHGDKGVERNIIPLEKFLQFAKAFVNNGGGSIYVATDSSEVARAVVEDWPKEVADHVVRQSSVKGLSPDDKAAFNLGVSAHRTNTEAMTDVLALSKCTFFLHGLSALSEAVLYLNPELVGRAINLDDEEYENFPPKKFVERMMSSGKKKESFYH